MANRDVKDVSDVELREFADYYRKSGIKIPNPVNFPKSFNFYWKSFKYAQQQKQKRNEVIKT